MPVLYLVAMANTGTVALSHRGIVPMYLTDIIAPIIIVGCLLRMLFWVRSRNLVLNDRQVSAAARRATIVGGFIGVVFLVWLVALWVYGTVESRAHVALSIGITGIAAILGMMHLRRAAIVMVTVLTVPFALFLLTRGGVSTMIAINLFLVLTATLYVLHVASSDFKTMVLAQIETSRLSDENLRLANLDILTNLPNRRLFFGEADRLINAAAASGGTLAIGVLDLDGFKPVNDLHGHVAGDQILVQVAARLKEAAGTSAIVSRLGGDEFGIIVPGSVQPAEIKELGNHICQSLRQPFAFNELAIKLSGSIGFALYPEVGQSAQQLYERADYALYHVKQSGRGRATIFDKAHEVQVRTTSQIDQCLRRADLEAELFLNFQPLHDISADRTIAFEALGRWNSPELGHVAPGVFIPIAERSEMISTITHILLRKALAEMNAWPTDHALSFNLSMRDLMSPRSMLAIVSIVRESGIEPSRVGFEVTETALMGDADQALDAIRLIKALGAKVSLDDFGTGYSSLSQVHRFPFDKIKIDRSFVTGIETDHASRSIVRSVVDLCRSLNIGCVVEGMETEAQARILVALGCNEMQGYYFGRPITGPQVMEYLASQDAPENPKRLIA